VVHYDTTVDSVVSGSTVVDVSGNGINGTLTNGAAYSSTDRALTFDGTDDRITGTLNNPSGAWVNSIAFWFKRDVESGANGYDYVFKSGTMGGTSAMNIIITPSDQLIWTIYNHTVFTPSNIIENNRWYHVLTVYRGGVVNLTSVDIYVNGVNIANSTNGTAAQTLPANAVFVIANDTTSGYNFNGSISNFKIWGGVALTAEEVAMEYALGRTGKSVNLTDTSLCLGGTVPRAQLDVRGTGIFDGGLVIKYKNSLEYARDGGIMMSRAGLGNVTNKYSSQPIILDGGDAGAVDLNIRGGAIWSQWGGSQYGIAIKGSSSGNAYPYLQSPTFFVTNDRVGVGGMITPLDRLHVKGPMRVEGQSTGEAFRTYTGSGNASANSGVYVGANMNGGGGGGAVRLTITAQTNAGNSTGTWVYMLRKYYSSAQSISPWPAATVIYSSNNSAVSNIVLYTDSGAKLKFYFQGSPANFKWLCEEL
jgi:hypothetical protein